MTLGAGVIATPEVLPFQIGAEDRFIVVACDGLYSCFTPQNAVDFISAEMRKGITPGEVAKQMVVEAVHNRKCKDNVSVVVVQLRPPTVIDPPVAKKTYLW